MENMRNQKSRSAILSKYQERVDESHPFETWVHADTILVVNHAVEILQDNIDPGSSSGIIDIHRLSLTSDRPK